MPKYTNKQSEKVINEIALGAGNDREISPVSKKDKLKLKFKRFKLKIKNKYKLFIYNEKYINFKKNSWLYLFNIVLLFISPLIILIMLGLIGLKLNITNYSGVLAMYIVLQELPEYYKRFK